MSKYAYFQEDQIAAEEMSKATEQEANGSSKPELWKWEFDGKMTHCTGLLIFICQLKKHFKLKKILLPLFVDMFYSIGY